MSAGELVEVQGGAAEIVARASGMFRMSDLELALARVTARPLPQLWAVPGGVTLGMLSNRWLADMQGSLDPRTIGLYRLHFTAHLIPHFGAAQGIVKASIAEYGRERLRVVKRATVQKERSTLRSFLAWCHEQGYLSELPDFPDLPRRATGTSFHRRRRGKPTELSPQECSALIAALPEWAVSKKTGRFPVRARFKFMFETSLRPATLDALCVPEHYSRGAETLRISDEDDKARFGREVPLSAEARAALDAVCPDAGSIFGTHDYREQLKRAAEKVLPPHKAATFCAYDFRHGRLTQLAETGNLPGVAYLAGHKRVTTTSIYVKPGARAAKAVLGADASEQPSGSRIVRGLAELSAAGLRALEPPASEAQAAAEWQVLINALAELRNEAEQAAKHKPQKRAVSPRDPDELDDRVEAVVASGNFSAQLVLRARVGCSLARLRASLRRLTAAARVVKVRDGAGNAVWRVGAPAHVTRSRPPVSVTVPRPVPARESTAGIPSSRSAASRR